MGKIIFKSLISFLILFFLILIFLTYFGFKTDKFDTLIKDRANVINSNFKLDFNKTKIYFDIKDFKLLVKLQEPRVIVQNNEINLSKLDLSLPIKSFYTSDFILEKVIIGFEKNSIKDLTKVTKVFLPLFINKKLKKIFVKGILEGEFVIFFNTDGSIKKNITFNGKINKGIIDLPEDYKIENLYTEINYTKSNQVDILKVNIKKGKISNIDFSESLIKIEFKGSNKKIQSTIQTSGIIKDSEIKKIFSIFNIKNNFIEIVNLNSDLITNINFDINDKFKVTNTSYKIDGDINDFNLKIKKEKIFNSFFPSFDQNILLKNTKINLSGLKGFNGDQEIKLTGNIKFSDKFEKFKYLQVYKKKNKKYFIDFQTSLRDSNIEIKQLNYKKKSGKEASIKIKSNFVLKKYYLINSLIFSDNESELVLEGFKLNKNNELTNLKKVKVKTYIDGIINNNYSLEKNKNIIIEGDIFDAQPLLKSLFKSDNKQTFSKEFNSDIKVNIKKVIAGSDDDVSDLVVIANINSGSYDKLILKGNFSKNEIIEMSIYKIDDNKKTLQVLSDRARPFIRHFNFIQGFEGGKLEYDSTIFKTHSDSNLLIQDFKVSKVPALAKLLTLASLQGIADTLSGEGIRFDILEMKSRTKDNVLTIEDTLAMGPAVSILLDGYIDKGKVVSLRGTLVPATKLNAIISKIPLVGNILVGKKTGEGVVGVSFKMKGPPKDIKTSVDPIKTLTPRFIVRAVEKMKKNKKKEKTN